MYRNNNLHILDLIGRTASEAVDRDSVYFFITDKISDTGFIMKTVLNLMDKGCNTFYFYGKYKDIWHRTVKDLSGLSDMDCKNLGNCDSIDDTAGKAASFLNSGRDVYLLYDSHELCTLVTDKIREHEMHVSFHTGSLINSME